MEAGGNMGLLKWWRLYRRIRKVRNFLHGIQWVNVLAVLAQVVHVLPSSPAVLVANAILGAVLPSLGGISHVIDGTKVVPNE
jgi:hypothetical protein